MEKDVKYYGTVYVFDFDDTLMWNEDWYDKVPLLGSGIAIGPGKSPAMMAAFDFIEKAKNRNDIPDNLRDMKLQVADNPKFSESGREIYFQLLDANNNLVDPGEIREYFSDSELKSARIDGPSEYSYHMGVIGDLEFYFNLDTLGGLGPNHEMINLYKMYHDNAVVLTARVDRPGMNEKISEILEQETGFAPVNVYSNPVEMSPEDHKGSVIADIASQDSVNKVYFWDDNLEYIRGVQKYLDEYDELNNTNLKAKVIIQHVRKERKPTTGFISSYQIIKFSRQLEEISTIIMERYNAQKV